MSRVTGVSVTADQLLDFLILMLTSDAAEFYGVVESARIKFAATTSRRGRDAVVTSLTGEDTPVAVSINWPSRQRWNGGAGVRFNWKASFPPISRKYTQDLLDCYDPPGSELLVFIPVLMKTAYLDMFEDMVRARPSGHVLATLVPPGRGVHNQLLLPPWIEGGENGCIVTHLKAVVEKSGSVYSLCARGMLLAIDADHLTLSRVCTRAFIDCDGRPLYSQSMASLVQTGRTIANFFIKSALACVGTVNDDDSASLAGGLHFDDSALEKLTNCVEPDAPKCGKCLALLDARCHGLPELWTLWVCA